MSANISKVNGQAELMYVGEVPWHGLGTPLPQLAIAAEAIEAAHLGWTVIKKPLYYEKGFNTPQHPDIEAVVRQDTGDAIGWAGRQWQPLQNKDAFSFLDAVIGEKAAVYETCGALGGGQRVWLLARLNDVCDLGDGDRLVRYLLLSNTHTAGQSVKVKLVYTRVVCANTLSVALGEATSALVQLRHDRRLGGKVTQVREAIGLVNKRTATLEAQLAKLAVTPVDTSRLAIFGEALGWRPDSDKPTDKERWAQFQDAFETSPGANLASARGTLWGAVNAVTYWVDHAKDFRATKAASAADNKLTQVLWGSGDQLKSKALEVALAMAK